MGEMQRLTADTDHAVAYAPGVALYVWRGNTPLSGAKASATAIRKVGEMTTGGRGVLLGLVEAGTPAPDTDVRKAIADAMRTGNGIVQASALVFEGRGFQASMVRMVAAGLALLARQSFPHHVFANLAEATAWLQTRWPGISAAKLEAMMEELRTS